VNIVKTTSLLAAEALRIGSVVRRIEMVLAVLLVSNGCDSDLADIDLPRPSAEYLDELDEIAEAAAFINETAIRATVAELAGDAYEGRGPGSNGDLKAQAYLAQRLAELGYDPGSADGGWYQRVALVSVEARAPESWLFVADTTEQGGEYRLARGVDFIASSGVQTEVASIVDAELVFVGYGIQAPEYGWDDFKGVDLTGKVLVVLNNDPHWDDTLFEGKRRLYYGRWTYKYESAARRGAAGAIIIHTDESAGYPWQVVQTSWSGANFELPAEGRVETLQVAAWATYPSVAAMLETAGLSLDALVAQARSPDFRPVALNLRTSITLENEINAVETANVLGLLRGSDPALAEEVVIYTAHHDHLGLGRPNLAGDLSDRIYNGARDNASGAAMVLAIAGAFQALPRLPRRSVLFAFVGAEEQGLLGSLLYARQPTFPPGRIAANINYDSANIWGATRDVVFIGKGKSTLDAVAEQVAAYQGRVLVGDTAGELGRFYRSDQFSLARIGVPGIYVKGGSDFVGREPGWGPAQMRAYTQRHYHQPSDQLTDDWAFSGMVQDASFGFQAGWLISNAQHMPRWYQGDEFEPARLRALEAVR